MCAHPFKAELFLQVFDTKNLYTIAIFKKKMKIDDRKQREERFLYVGLSVPHNAISIYSMFTIFLHSIQRSGLNNSTSFRHF